MKVTIERKLHQNQQITTLEKRKLTRLAFRQSSVQKWRLRTQLGSERMRESLSDAATEKMEKDIARRRMNE